MPALHQRGERLLFPCRSDRKMADRYRTRKIKAFYNDENSSDERMNVFSEEFYFNLHRYLPVYAPSRQSDAIGNGTYENSLLFTVCHAIAKVGDEFFGRALDPIDGTNQRRQFVEIQADFLFQRGTDQKHRLENREVLFASAQARLVFHAEFNGHYGAIVLIEIIRSRRALFFERTGIDQRIALRSARPILQCRT